MPPIDRGTKDDNDEEGAKPSVEDSRHDAERAMDAIVILIFSFYKFRYRGTTREALCFPYTSNELGWLGIRF